MVIGAKMAKKKLLLDIDEVVCFCGILQAVNDFMGTNYVIDDFTDYYIDEVAIPKEYFNDFNEFLSHRNLYEVPDLLPKAIETLQRLNEHFDIYVCSSCLNPLDLENSGRIFQDKFNFLRNGATEVPTPNLVERKKIMENRRFWSDR